MPDMKVRIVIENVDGTVRTATLSFEGKPEETSTKSAPSEVPAKPKKPVLMRRLIGMGFIVRETLPLLESGMLGELHVERLREPRGRCRECGEPLWVLMEVIEDRSVKKDPQDVFIEVDHDLIGEFCLACGDYGLNEDAVGSGVFGLLDDEEFPGLGDFLDSIEAHEPDVLMRTRYLRMLMRQERLHMKAVYRLRERFAELHAERQEAEVMDMNAHEEGEEP